MMKLNIKNELVNALFEIPAVIELLESYNGLISVGETKEGKAFQDQDGSVVIFKAIAKKENFDLADALQEKADAVAAAAQKAEAKAKKVKAVKAPKADEIELDQILDEMEAEDIADLTPEQSAELEFVEVDDNDNDNDAQ